MLPRPSLAGPLILCLAAVSCSSIAAQAPSGAPPEPAARTSDSLESPAVLLTRANELLASGKSQEALDRFQALAESWGKDPSLVDEAQSARFNQALAHTALKQPDKAAELLRSLSADARSPDLRASARHNLGLAEAELAEQALTRQDRAGAIDLYRRAERSFRNAAEDQRRASGSPDTDTRRNIEVAQRKAAKLEEQQRQEEQKKQQDQQGQDKKQQQGKDQDQQQRQDQQQQQQSQQQPGQPKDQKSGQQQQQNQQQQGSEEPKPPEDGQQQPQPEPKPGDQPQPKPAEDTNPQQDAASAQSQQDLKDAQQAYDRTAMQILDKERQNRAMLRQLLKRMRGRIAPVDKDW